MPPLLQGRMEIALAFNRAVREGRLTAPVVLSRDHHDVSGTDSPFRETSNITDGSMFCADMAIQNVIGDSFRGATWVSIHNGGGTGWGEAVNGGFGCVSVSCAGALTMFSRGVCLCWMCQDGIGRIFGFRPPFHCHVALGRYQRRKLI
jgi:urocanate hydratase